jgi:hypothetical protein
MRQVVILVLNTEHDANSQKPVPDSLLVNGAGKFICSMAVPARPVDCVDIQDEDVLAILGRDDRMRPIRLRVVNVGYATDSKDSH